MVLIFSWLENARGIPAGGDREEHSPYRPAHSATSDRASGQDSCAQVGRGTCGGPGLSCPAAQPSDWWWRTVWLPDPAVGQKCTPGLLTLLLRGDLGKFIQALKPSCLPLGVYSGCGVRGPFTETGVNRPARVSPGPRTGIPAFASDCAAWRLDSGRRKHDFIARIHLYYVNLLKNQSGGEVLLCRPCASAWWYFSMKSSGKGMYQQ